jgi:hypothetical protein
MLQNLYDYYDYLITYGFLNGINMNPVKFWTDLMDDDKTAKLLSENLNDEQRNKIELKLKELFLKHKTLLAEPLSLKLMSRNRIRFLINSLSAKNLSHLNLPKNLINYLFNN